MDPHWRKSSYSTAQSNCVEIAELAPATHYGIRDSVHPHADHLTIPTSAWTAFLASVKDGELGS
ncbi:MAG: DUF397 domain-containing protein [Nocardiopsaceae bacterium]|nr:DUF397 domain-containing protein [Nocardiopsaceae bacterium]